MYHQIQGQEVIKAPGTTSSTTQLGAVETPSVPSLKQTFSSWWGRRGLPVAPNFYLLQLLHWRDYADASLVRSSKVPGHLTPVRVAPTCQKKPEIIKVGEDVENPGEVQMGFLTLGHQLPQAQLVPSGPRCVPVGV